MIAPSPNRSSRTVKTPSTCYAIRRSYSVGGEFGGQVFDPQGNFVSASRFPFADLAAVAESPGGRWFAVARPGSVCIYEETEPPPREYFPITCLEADAVDLAWR
jgi:hypothetical protein